MLVMPAAMALNNFRRRVSPPALSGGGGVGSFGDGTDRCRRKRERDMRDRSDSERLDALEAKLDALQSREDIRQCLYRASRGMDRRDEAMIASAYHPDAQLRWRSESYTPIGDWLKTAMTYTAKTSRVQHMIGNVLIDLRGDEADVESYELARHLTPTPNGIKDIITGSRFVDSFARRDGAWRIARRIKVTDWLRVLEGEDPLYDNAAPHGRRDLSDLSYETFGEAVFRGPA